ncbi:MAG: hypothetical protein IPK22_05840 [Verrucomicrobiaceae bacterium]|nr:hypothetical protein [Verrucomicrobiaceae bacterium]
MADEENWSLIAQPGRSLAREGSAGRCIVEEMVTGALEIMEAQTSALVPRFAIGEHLLSEPTYLQILAWADELGLKPELVLEHLLRLPEAEKKLWGWKDDMRTLIEDGRLKRIALNRDWLPVDCARWQVGLVLESLVIWGGAKKLTYFKPQLPELKRLWIVDQQLNELVISEVPKLQFLDCTNNQITELDLSKVPALQELRCTLNELVELDLTAVSALRVLRCGGNQITELDLSAVPALLELGCETNKISKLDLSAVPELQELFCLGNLISELDITPLKALNSLIYFTEAQIPLIQRPDQNF